MKKIIIIFVFLFPTISFSFEKSTNFKLEEFYKLQSEDKTIVINSWNKYCSTCAAQTKIFSKAINEFKEIEFLFYEQTENENIAKALGVKYWTTILVFKGKKEVGREIGLIKKDDIYTLIKKGI